MALSSDEKLRALGLKDPTTTENLESGNFDRLRESIDYVDFRDEVSAFEGLADPFDDLEAWFEDLDGFDGDQANQFRLNVEQKYQNNYHAFVESLNENESYEEWEAEFRYGTTIGGDSIGGDGDIIHGITFHEDAAVSQSGVRIPAGTVEIFAPRVEFSETAPPEDEGEGINIYKFTVDPTHHFGSGSSAITGYAENTSSIPTTRSVSLYINGERVDTNSITLPAGGEGEVEFLYYFSDYGNYEVVVGNGDLDPITVFVDYSELSTNP